MKLPRAAARISYAPVYLRRQPFHRTRGRYADSSRYFQRDNSLMQFDAYHGKTPFIGYAHFHAIVYSNSRRQRHIIAVYVDA